MSGAQVLAFGLEADLGGRRVVDGVDLSMEGGVITVVGPNGAGKSTLLRILATVIVPPAGRLSIDGLDPAHESDRIEIRRRLGHLPQHPAFAERASVYDVLDYVAVLKEIRPEQRRSEAIRVVLAEVGLLDRVADPVGALSGGMRRRLGLAQALLGRPRLLVLDEPSAELDPDERLRLRGIISARRTDATIVVASHQIDDAAVSDRIVVLDEGRVAFDGSPARLAAQADGRVWLAPSAPPGSRTHWVLPDGRVRCLGSPPPGVSTETPTLEEGYLVVRSRTAAVPPPPVAGGATS